MVIFDKLSLVRDKPTSIALLLGADSCNKTKRSVIVLPVLLEDLLDRNQNISTFDCFLMYCHKVCAAANK